MTQKLARNDRSHGAGRKETKKKRLAQIVAVLLIAAVVLVYSITFVSYLY